MRVFSSGGNSILDIWGYIITGVSSLVGAVVYSFTNFASKKEVDELKKELTSVKDKTENRIDQLSKQLNDLALSVAKLQIEAKNISLITEKILENDTRNGENITKILTTLEIKKTGE